MNKTSNMKLIERIYDKDIETLLKEDYTIGQMSIRAIAKKYGISHNTLNKWIIAFDVPKKQIEFFK